MQVARRRWSAVLIAGSALAPKGTCVRAWLSHSGSPSSAAFVCGTRPEFARVPHSTLTDIETAWVRAPNRDQPSATQTFKENVRGQ